MWQQTNNEFISEHAFEEFLVLDLISKNSTNYVYIVSYQKTLFEATVPLISLRTFGRNGLQFGTVLNGNFSADSQSRKIRVSSVRRIYMLTKAQNNKWTQLKLEFDDRLKKHVIACSALTSGCFTYQEREYRTPAVFNDVLGIVVDSDDEPHLPRRQIGRLLCTVTAIKCSSEGIWKLRIETIKKFDAVLSLAMEANVRETEHFGLVTREECEEKRDLRLVSCRDFPRDVRIFRSGSHCCESIESGQRRPHHHHSKCLNTCVGQVSLIGRCMAFQMKRCNGMNSAPSLPIPIDSVAPLLSLPSPPSPPEGHHVDFGSMRGDVAQLEVHVQSGFVEVVTIAEYSGYTDHNGQPLLWSHDVEFVVDISGMFRDQNLGFGLYKIKVVRFHRNNVFAKWRLARKNPIMMAMQTRFHSQSAHSINLATMSINTISINDEQSVEAVVEEAPRQRLPSFSRFGSTAQSCCLPRTDSLDDVELYDALVRNERASSFSAPTRPTPTVSTTPLGTRRLNYGRSMSVSVANKIVERDDDLLWAHHDNSVSKIVEDDDEAVLPKIPPASSPDENLNHAASNAF
ncbi:hypothetical protein L3Y34_003400 [Caenorhabditis briggsae]|uniref:Uncharacterized protein n=1 Tax=Caenorhabditis briggsae TaxID=6238 RepID=A0AAE9A997_CAEBR|nr:hypothetical protein L3Y34_003400 [Caenorhabditis briggsae]